MQFNVKVIKDSVIYKGAVYQLGSVFDCEKSIAESLITRGIVEKQLKEVIDAEVTIIEDEVDSEDLSVIDYQELKQLDKQKGLSANGKKEELIQRIQDTELETDEEMPNTSMPE